MEWINYHHLYYFWQIAREQSVSQAALTLHVSQPTLSIQLSKLEKSLNCKLIERNRRRFKLTETGEFVFEYAEKIFGLGRELTEQLKSGEINKTTRLRVGVPNSIPRLMVQQFLAPCLAHSDSVKLHCSTGQLNELLGELAKHELDIVLSDSPVTPELSVRAYNHQLGVCGVSVFASPTLRQTLGKDFPHSLDGAPLLLTTRANTLRRNLEHYFEDNRMRMNIIHEFDDSGIMKTFGQAGHGLFFAPTIVQPEICRQYNVQTVGELPDLKERFYAISTERKLRNPAVQIIIRSAKQQLESLH